MGTKSIKWPVFIVILIVFGKLSDIITNPLITALCFVIYIIAMWLLINWETFNAYWVCDKCGERFEISFAENFKSSILYLFKNRLYYRQLHCGKCDEVKWCRCIFKDKKEFN